MKNKKLLIKKLKRVICVDCGRKIYFKFSDLCRWKSGYYHCKNRKKCISVQVANKWLDKLYES